MTTDAGMFPAATFLASKLAAMANRRDVDVVVVTPTPEDAPHAAACPLPFRIVHASEDSRFREVAAQYGPIKRISNYRLFLPAVFAQEYSRILYLDTDIYVTDARVFALFDLDMQGFPIAAVRDLSIGYSLRRRLQLYRQDVLGESRKYLNAGVLLLDTAAFNGEDALPALIASLESKDIELRYSEQSSLNRVLPDRWLELSPAFNMFPAWKYTFVWKAYSPAIIHFVGRAKPWTELRYLEIPHVQDEMRDYLSNTPWQDFFSTQRTARDQGRYAAIKPVVDYRLRFLWPILRPFFRQTPFERLDWKAIAVLLAAGDFADVAARITRPELARIPRHLLARPARRV